MLVKDVRVDGVYVADGARYSSYNTTGTSVSEKGGSVQVNTECSSFVFKSKTDASRVGVMLVGLGGSNGSTFLAGILANKRKIQWREKTGLKAANFLGSIASTRCTTIGTTKAPGSSSPTTMYVPLRSLAAFPDPREFCVSGWDISAKDLYKAQLGAQVLHPELLDQLKPDLEVHRPYPAVLYGTWLASTQLERSDNLLPISRETTYRDIVDTLRGHIRDFKAKNGLDTSNAQTMVLWTASTERCCDEHLVVTHLSTKDQLLEALGKVVCTSVSEYLAPSLLYAIASVEEGCNYINGAPQNTFTPGLREYARSLNCLLIGDDFKTGQTKFKSFLADMLISSGLRVRAITSYNHLGNNDGYNLSQESQFKSKELSKTSVIDDIINRAPCLYSRDANSQLQPSLDHTVVIKYVPYVGDSKRAIDEYVSEIFMNGTNTISVYNVCEDTLLAVPIMIDIVCFTSLLSNVEVAKVPSSKGYISKVTKETLTDLRFEPVLNFMPVMSLFFKAPMSHTANRSDVVNAFAAQFAAMEDFIRALAGLQPLSALNVPDLLQ